MRSKETLNEMIANMFGTSDQIAIFANGAISDNVRDCITFLECEEGMEWDRDGEPVTSISWRHSLDRQFVMNNETFLKSELFTEVEARAASIMEANKRNMAL